MKIFVDYTIIYNQQIFCNITSIITIFICVILKVYIVLYETMYNDNIYSSLYIVSYNETMYNINNQLLKSQCIKVSKKFIK